MYSIKLIESAFEDLKRISKSDFYLCDSDGEILVNTFLQLGIDKELIQDFINSSADSQNIKGFFLIKIPLEEENLILVVNAPSNDGYMISRMAASETKYLLGLNTGNVDKEDFYNELLLDNIMPGEIDKRAKKLKIKENINRVVYYISIDEEFTDSALELLKNIFSESKDDMVIAMKEGQIVIIKTVDMDNSEDEKIEFANLSLSMINTELMIKAKVTYGRTANNLKKLSEAYREAAMAYEVASIFYEEKDIASYTSLGIGRLIHQLPEGLCLLFLEEVFGSNMSKLSKEDINIVESFFENNLNVAETARSLSMKRTTLIYRLDKLVNQTGMDIRKFEDALTLKIAMMVAKYMDYCKNKG